MEQTKVLPFIPQRPPFVMIDEVLTADEQVTRTSFTIREGHTLVENGLFTESGLVENMAQTAAAGTGYTAQKENKPAPVGFIGSIKNLQVLELPKVGDTIQTEAVFQSQVMNAHLIKGTVYNNGKEIAGCILTIFLKED